MTKPLDKELERKLMLALDDQGDLDALVREEPSLATSAQEFGAIDGWLREWETPLPPEDELELLALRIEQRLDEPLDESFDPTLPPVFDDEDARVRPSADAAESDEYALERLVAPPETPQANAAMTTGPAEVVDLGARREASRIPVILAVAAMAGLAMTGGVFVMTGSSPQMSASMERAESAEATNAGPAPAPQGEFGALADEAPTEAAEAESGEEARAVRRSASGAGAEPPAALGAAAADDLRQDGDGSRFALAEPAEVNARGAGGGGAPMARRPRDNEWVDDPVAPAPVGRTTGMRSGVSPTPNWARLRACLSSPPRVLEVRVRVVDHRMAQLLSTHGERPVQACLERGLRARRFSVADGERTVRIPLHD